MASDLPVVSSSQSGALSNDRFSSQSLVPVLIHLQWESQMYFFPATISLASSLSKLYRVGIVTTI